MWKKFVCEFKMYLQEIPGLYWEIEIYWNILCWETYWETLYCSRLSWETEIYWERACRLASSLTLPRILPKSQNSTLLMRIAAFDYCIKTLSPVKNWKLCNMKTFECFLDLSILLFDLQMHSLFLVNDLRQSHSI